MGPAGGSRKPWCRWFSAAVACAAALAPPSLAQSERRAPPAEIVSIDLGWTTTELVRDRWQPAVVWITSRDKPFSGVLTASFPQDTTQDAEVMVGPVATTPGMVTPVEIAISPRAETREIVFTLQDGRFRTRHRFTRTGGGGDSPMPRVGSANSGLLLFVGQSSATKVLAGSASVAPSSTPATSPQETPAFSEERVWEGMLPASIAPQRLPMSWGVYESLDVVIANASDIARASARSRAALATWVRSGGRLVLRVDPVGPAWPAFLPTDGAEPPVVGSAQQFFEAGADLRQHLGRWAGAPFQARALTLTDEGRARGWTTLFSAGVKEGDAAGSVVACGPLGMGMVTLVGFDPQHAAQLIPDEAVKDLWRAIIRPALPPHALLSGWQQYNYGATAVDWESTGAVNSALDELAAVPPVGASVFWAIILCMLTLVVLVGPFDALVLKRRRLSQHSWLTALAWIGIACLGAALAPRVMRSGQTVMGRLVVTDRLCGRDGQPTHSAHTGLTGIFAGKPLRIALGNPAPGAWVRGVSATQVYWSGGSPVSLLPDLPLVLAGDPEHEDIRTMWAGPMGVPQWTYRALCDSAPLRPVRPGALGASVRREDGRWGITMTNVPSGAEFEELVLRTQDGWHVVSGAGAPSPNGRDREFLTSGPAFQPGQQAAPAAVGRWLREGPANAAYMYAPSNSTTASLPGVRERESAVNALLASGRWACVYAKVRGLPLDLATDGTSGHQLQKSDYLRLLTPLEDAS